MRRLLSGETGSGKTVVFALAAAACVDGGGRVAILTPNSRVATQTRNVIAGWWPDLKPSLVTGDACENDTPLTDQRLLVGTTALLHRDVGRLDLVVVDEQQKFSREQREKLSAGGAHLLEASATCIPRSQALIRYGALQVSRLRQTHTRRDIHTRILHRDDRLTLFESVKETVADGGQVIVIYPRKQVTNDPQPTDLFGHMSGQSRRGAVESASTLWEKCFPGRVVVAHGGLDEADNAAAMQALRDNAADVLVATTVVEVGIDLPRVRRVVVVHPQYLGLTQLHQLRGRAARTGGKGEFDLYLPDDISDKTLVRLEALTQTDDGFEIAKMDLQLRGAGDLSGQSERQWGEDNSFLFGRPLRLDLLDTLLDASHALSA